MSCPLRCLIVVFGGSSLALRSSFGEFGEQEAGYFASLWFVVCVLSVMVCLLFLLVSLVGYIL